MQLIKVANIQRASVYDGSGVRTTIFLKGCNLNCPWCCNPETKSKRAFFINQEKCLSHKGIDSKLCSDCIKKGGKRSLSLCPFGVYEVTYKEYSADQLFDSLNKDFSLFKLGGGITFSGGEPLLQTDRLLPLLIKLKGNDINIAVETTLFVDECKIEKIKPFINEWIVDLKLQPHMFINDSNYLRRLEQNLSIIRNDRNINIIFRLVVVKDLRDQISEIKSILTKLNIVSIELLKCHNLAERKYHKLEEENRDYSVSDTEFKEFVSVLTNHGLKVSTLTI